MKEAVITNREKISTKTTLKPKISPLNPRLKGTINFAKQYVEVHTRIIVKINAGNPAGKTKRTQKILHKIMVLLLTFLRYLVNPDCFDKSQ